MKTLIGTIVSLSLLLGSFTASADSVESVFQDAARYTVKIETTTLHPFLEDEEGVATGSGFLVNKEKGWVLTNRHVVAEGPANVEVRFKEEKYFAAQKIYLDPNLDLALVRVSRESIPNTAIEAPLGCYEEASIGNAVVIFGHPSGLNFTGTRGIVSGTIYTYSNEWIQTDAPLNAGNSGGPLINIKSGKVIGVNAAKHNGEDTEGLNFAVSIDHVCKIMELIEAGQNPSPPDLPVIFVAHDLDDQKLEVARSFFEDSALLSPGDIITGIQGDEEFVTNIDQLNYLLRGKEGKVEISVIRNDREMVVEIPVAPLPYILDQEAITFSGITLKSQLLVDRAEHSFSSSLFVVGVI
ncbi:S1C family serine protease, partial [Pseudomonadota bacterium]